MLRATCVELMLRPEVLPTGSCLFVFCFVLVKFVCFCLFDISILFGHFMLWVFSFRVC